LGSAATLAVANQVTIPDGIPTISPTATSPEITVLADNGFVFRGTPSDAAQAPVLAMLALREGARHLAVFFQDDAYGRGLASALDEHFAGPITHQPVDSVHASTFEAELIAAAAAGADTLIAMSYVPTAAIYLREAASLGLFERVLLVDATASPDLAKALGADAVEGFKGTAPAGVVAGLEGAESRNAGQGEPGHEDTNTGARSFATTFEAATGRRPTSGLEALAYDLVICVALATEHAGQLDRDAIRRALPAVCGQGGRQIHPDAESIAMGLASARNHEAIDYDGASGALEWDARGDIATGSISIWQFKAGRITVLESIPFDLR
jgi:branched-chain amino acid transport system substrate-binding protein